jgi:hypothetical protein
MAIGCVHLRCSIRCSYTQPFHHRNHPITNSVCSAKTMKSGLKIRFIFLIWGLFLLTASYAQNIQEDIVYLKNGSVIRGEILKEENPGYLRIRTEGDNIWSFARSDIDSVGQGERISRIYQTVRKNGFQNITGFGVLVGSGESDKSTVFSLATVNGYYFYRKWFTGAHLGVELYEYSTCPVGGDVRYNFFPGRWSNFLYLKGGYAFALGKPEEPWGYHYKPRGGPWLGLGAGLDIRVNERNSLLFEIAYRYQDLYLYYTTDWQTEEIKETTRFNRLEIGFAVSFR